MLEKSQRDLQRSVRRKLAARLLIVTLPLAAFASTAVFLVERDRIGEDVITWTIMQAELFNAQGGQLLDRLEEVGAEDLEAALAEFAAQRDGGPLGRFNAVEIFRLGGDKAGRFVRPETLAEADADRLFEAGRYPSDTDTAWSEVVRLEKAPHLTLQMPLADGSGAKIGFMRGIFRPAPSIVASVRGRALRAALAVALLMGVVGAVLWPMLVKLINRLGDLSSSLLEANLGTLDALGRALAKRDGDTEEHSLRVTILSALLAEEVGMERSEIQSLIKGASLHDVGKIAIRDEILLKPGKLTDEEYEVMKSHVDHGVDIVSRSSWLESARDVVHYHHERFGGGGYAEGLTGTAIPLPARIFTIVDVFDALSSHRPYKEAVGFERSMAIMRDGRGEHFDPELFDAFERIAPEAYERYYGSSAEDLGGELDRLVDRYFSGGLDALQVG